MFQLSYVFAQIDQKIGINEIAANLGSGRPGDLATGLLKGLSGLLPGLDAAKLLQQQSTAPDSQANGMSF